MSFSWLYGQIPTPWACTLYEWGFWKSFYNLSSLTSDCIYGNILVVKTVRHLKTLCYKNNWIIFIGTEKVISKRVSWYTCQLLFIVLHITENLKITTVSCKCRWGKWNIKWNQLHVVIIYRFDIFRTKICFLYEACLTRLATLYGLLVY